MQQIDLEIGRQFDLGIKNVIPFRDAFILNTTQGKKLLKKVEISPERVLFIHGAKEHLFNNGFQYIDRYTCTTDGKPYFIAEQACFTLTDYPDGVECNFENESEMSAAVKALAELHKASKGYVAPAESFPRDELGKLPVTFKKRLGEIKKIQKTAGRGKSKFDYMVLEFAEYFYSQGKEALDNVLKPKYGMLVNEVRKQRTICHHDYTHYNILFTCGNITVTNFNYCCYELKIHDIANLIRRKMRKCCWNMDETIKIINNYCKYEELSTTDLDIMYSILQFPQKFWRIVNKYYNSKRSWSEKFILPSCVKQWMKYLITVNFWSIMTDLF